MASAPAPATAIPATPASPTANDAAPENALMVAISVAASVIDPAVAVTPSSAFMM